MRFDNYLSTSEECGPLINDILGHVENDEKADSFLAVL